MSVLTELTIDFRIAEIIESPNLLLGELEQLRQLENVKLFLRADQRVRLTKPTKGKLYLIAQTFWSS